jgi:hypothetical protein
LSEIARRALEMSNKNSDELRKMQFILRVPRLHREYINQNGLDPYVEKFTAVLTEYQSILDEKMRAEKQIGRRANVSLFRHKI